MKRQLILDSVGRQGSHKAMISVRKVFDDYHVLIETSGPYNGPGRTYMPNPDEARELGMALIIAAHEADQQRQKKST